MVEQPVVVWNLQASRAFQRYCDRIQEGSPLKLIWKKLLLFFITLLPWITSCQPGQDATVHDHFLFRAVTAEASGVDFANTLQETNRQNFLTYPYFYNGGGVAVGDLDNDGLDDLFFTGNMAGDRLYHNQGNLQFTDITPKASILKQNLWTTGVTMADVNNDGYLDIYVCRSGNRGFRHNLLYINQGDLTFSEQARLWGVNDNGYSTQATFFDYDLDGDLDLYLVNHSVKFNFNQEEIFKSKYTPAPEEADQLYRNDGDHFTNVSQAAGIQRFAFGLSAIVSDVNGDGYPDIYAASDFFEPDFLYINQQDGTFEECLKQSIGHISFSSMGSDIADYNNDGLPDIVVADMRAEDHYRFQANMVGMNRNKFARMLKEGYHYQYMQNSLQLHRGVTAQGLPLFSEVGQLAGISNTDWSWSTLLFDMDNDGWKDLFISNGIRRDIQNKDAWTTINDHRHKQKSFLQMQEYFPVARLQNYTFRNNRQLGFTNVSSVAGIDFKGFTNGVAYADLDNDGDLDLVLNNLDDPAMIYENLARTQNQQHYLQIRLQGQEDNHFGLGAKVTLHYNDQQQYQELTATRGFQSSVAPVLHFGIGEHDRVDKITVTWPNGTYQEVRDVPADQKMVIDQKEAQPSRKMTTPTRSEPLLHEIKPLPFVHQEAPYDDFSREPLLPFKLSSQGPCLAVGDINGDGQDDLYVGNGNGYAGALFVQREDGTFKKQTASVLNQDRQYEDADAVFFDADQDQDLDLYVVSGSNEYEAHSPGLQDRLYTNDGHGNFTRATLPDLRINGSCVAPADVDRDGDIDLFVGGSCVSGNYPLSAPSYLLINEKGTFLPQEIPSLGMVTDAVWADVDQDQDEDLVVVGQWMPITLLENQQGTLVPGVSFSIQDTAGQATLTSGWWNCITAADLDEDGDLDFVVGNEGRNTRFSASTAAPLEIYAQDFDHNGSQEAIIAYYDEGKLYPVPGRDKLLARLPSWQRKFSNYHTYAQATMDQLLEGEADDSLVHKQVTQLASCLLYNKGKHTFTLQELPIEAQLSAVNDVVVEDINHDGYKDLVMAGNRYGWEVETTRNDAGIGLCLLGEEKHTFRPLSLQESGFLAPGNVRRLQMLHSANGARMLLTGKNQDTLQCFALPASPIR